jgi:hypothetical protein
MAVLEISAGCGADVSATARMIANDAMTAPF